MAIKFTRTLATNNTIQLKNELNESVDITATCVSIKQTGSSVDITWNADLIEPTEVDAMDAVIAAHIPQEEEVPVSRFLVTDSLGGKLAVHASSKPEPEGISTFAVWAGAGDDPGAATAAESLGNGEMLAFSLTPGTSEVNKDVWFDPRHGMVWLHEAYIKFEGAGIGDYLQADIMAPATQLQQAVNLDLVVDGDGWVTLAPGGPGTGTHGFAATPSLLPREFSMDGDWDYDGTNLTPNLTGEGGYKINSNEMSVHRYFSHIPLMGNSYGFATMSSDETAYLPAELGYFIRITVHNVSDGTWNLSCIMEIFRERTVDP